MKKIFTIIFAAIFILAAVVVVGKDSIVRVSAEKVVESTTGLKLSIKKLDCGIVRTDISVQGIVLYNPLGFEDRIMMDMPSAYVDYDLPAILKGDMHFPEMRLELKEFVVVKNERGELSLNYLKIVGKDASEASSSDETSASSKIRIDKLDLKIGKVVYKDYSAGGEPMVKEFNLNVNETYEDIDDAEELVTIVVVKALKKTTIASLANFNISSLQKTITGTTNVVVRGATGALAETTRDLTKVLGMPLAAKEENTAK